MDQAICTISVKRTYDVPEANPSLRRGSEMKETKTIYNKEESNKQIPYINKNKVINTLNTSNLNNNTNNTNNKIEIVETKNELVNLNINVTHIKETTSLTNTTNLKKEKPMEILDEKVPSEEALPREHLPVVEVPYIKEKLFPLKKKYCLVLDLDETLIHYKTDRNNPEDGEMLIRPYMYEFLNKVGQFYELILFTAGTEEVRKLFILIWNII